MNRKRFFIVLLLAIVAAFVLFERSSGLSESIQGAALIDYDLEAEGWVANSWEELAVNAIDGPYVFSEDKDRLRVIRVDRRNDHFVIDEGTVPRDSALTLRVKVDNAGQDQFTVGLRREFPVPPDTYPMPERLLAVSDIEGNFDAFSGLLQANGVVDRDYHWAFGNGHLVLVGDLVDRGDNVIPCLWLIYQLEQEAAQQGGRVHVILGNHERLNLMGMARYVNRKYIALGQRLSGEIERDKAFSYLMSPDAHLAEWLRSKNILEKIGNMLFVHGGISAEVLDLNAGISQINQIAQRHIDRCDCPEAPLDDFSRKILEADGPLWYRGLVDYPSWAKEDRSTLVDRIRRQFGVERIAVGHTIVDAVSTDFDGHLVRLDISQPKTKGTGQAQALFIDNGRLYRVNDRGERTAL